MIRAIRAIRAIEESIFGAAIFGAASARQPH